ncbi:UNVERIFIED_CONTAM: BTB/POZ domain-containing protein POB1 [Sesamum radiatum]|uniref:BTB/POZ domain-containing protein POB1 n=1 Tax=Sesamum radiatum TaxID=300843 RepID=A0AAW2JSX1_SESRA
MSMDSGALPDTGSPESSSDFAFAFNDVNFSDRVLRIEILPDTTGSKPDPDDSLADWARNRKRRRDDQLSNADDLRSFILSLLNMDDTLRILTERTEQREEQILNCNMPDLEDGVTYENQEEEAVAMVEESPVGAETTINQSGHEAAQGSEASSSMDYSEVQVKTIHISSPILAAKSPFFYKVSRVQFVLKWYERVRAATCDSAYPSLSSAADRCCKAVPCCTLKDIASREDFYDFVLKWARMHYPKLEERREILSTRLLRFVRFPCMTCRKLKKVLTCSDIEPELASKVVLDALFFKAEAPYRQRSLVAEEANASFRRFVERAYKYRPVKVVEFESPRQQCIVYLDLKREECAQLFPAGRVYSQAFHLGGQGFFLSGHCNMDQQSSFHCFGLFLGMQEKGSVAFTVDYEFASRTKPSEDFVSKYKGNYTFTGGKAVGYRNLFGVPWTAFIADDSPYFINGILHLRAELTIKK